MATFIGIASLVIGAVGAGLSYASSVSAAKTQDRLASINAANQIAAIRQQGEANSLQSRVNQQMALNEKAAFERNAKALEDQAEANSAAARENIRRTRTDYARLLAAKRVEIAASGVVDSAVSPWAQLLRVNGEGEMEADKQSYADANSRDNIFREAHNQRVAGQQSEFQITGYQIQAGAARQAMASAMSQARLDLMSQQAYGRAMRSQAVGGLISNAGGLFQQGYGLFSRMPRNTGTYSAIA